MDPDRMVASILTVKSLKESLDSSSTSSTSFTSNITQKSDTKKDKLNFDKVFVREFRVICGDNPSVSAGPPVQLDWANVDSFHGTVDEFEEERSHMRRSHYQMKIPEVVRKELLITHGHTEREIKECARKAAIVRKQRLHTMAATEAFPHLDERIEKFIDIFRKKK